MPDQESVSSLKAGNATKLPHHSLDENCKPLLLDRYHYPLTLDNRKVNHPGQGPRYHTLFDCQTDIRLQCSTSSCNRELNRIYQTTAVKKFEVIVKFLGLNPYPIPNSTQSEHRTFPVFCGYQLTLYVF